MKTVVIELDVDSKDVQKIAEKLKQLFPLARIFIFKESPTYGELPEKEILP